MESNRYQVLQEDLVLYEGDFDSCLRMENHLRNCEHGYIDVDYEMIRLDRAKLQVLPV